MGPVLITLLIVLLSLIVYAIHQGSKKNKYWAERGVPFAKPVLFLGNFAKSFLFKKNFIELMEDIVKEVPNEPIIGMYDFTQPVLLIKDHEMIEKVLIKDFMNFTDRGIPFDRRNAFEINLFFLAGKEWRALRYKLSPLFTTGKLRQMYGAMAECGDQLTNLLDLQKSEDIDMREMIGRFAMDVIGSCAFGIDAQNLKQPNNEFRKMGKKAIEFDFGQMIKMIFLSLFPKIGKLFQLSFTRRDVGEYFSKVVKDTVEYRKKHNIVRNDFLQYLMILKDKGTIELQIKDPVDDYLKMDATYSIESFEMNEDSMIGQGFSFLTTGFETTALTSMFTLYELAKNPEIQERVRKEILEQVEAAGGSLTYDAIKQMTYLEQCVKEALRIYPPAPIIMRICAKEYTFPNGLTIMPGQLLFIAANVVHNNPEIFPEPKQFRPERFDADQKIPSCAYIPFGNGPRICIAMRFALMEVNYCLAKLLMNYEFRISPKTKPFEMDKKSFFISPRNPILFLVKKIAVPT